MKRFTPSILTILFAVLLSACSEEAPSIRVRNDLPAEKANIQIKPAVGSTLNINNVEGGQSTGFQTIAEGGYTVSASIQSSKDTSAASFTAKNDVNYTVVVVNTTPPTVRVDSENK